MGFLLDGSTFHVSPGNYPCDHFLFDMSHKLIGRIPKGYRGYVYMSLPCRYWPAPSSGQRLPQAYYAEIGNSGYSHHYGHGPAKYRCNTIVAGSVLIMDALSTALQCHPTNFTQRSEPMPPRYLNRRNKSISKITDGQD